MVRHSKNILPKTTNPNPESNRYPPHPADPSHPSRYHLHLQAHHLRSPLLSASAENRRRDPQNLSTTKATSPSTHQSPILPDDIHSILLLCPYEHHTHNRATHRELHSSAVLNNNLVAFVPTAFPTLIYLVLNEDRFGESPFLRFITVLFPSSYSAAQYLLLPHTSWKETGK
uniref:Uncharacterized protein n=1 Tax=Encephalitozoon cuniculi TaxID=6035 RepID=M1KBR9_ENCCN|nr:hypothetical protein ECU06_1690 [Encephalitozoon cuniculi]